MTSVSRHILVQQFPHGINRKCPLHVGVPSTCHSQHDSAASEGGQATRVPSMEPLGGWQPQLQALFGLGLVSCKHCKSITSVGHNLPSLLPLQKCSQPCGTVCLALRAGPYHPRLSWSCCLSPLHCGPGSTGTSGPAPERRGSTSTL
jgi:hypothetical protein